MWRSQKSFVLLVRVLDGFGCSLCDVPRCGACDVEVRAHNFFRRRIDKLAQVTSRLSAPRQRQACLRERPLASTCEGEELTMAY
jgi:hypothetical protein